MCRRRLLSSCLVVTFLVGVAGHASAQQPDSAARPATLARFPGATGGVRLQLDGSAICSSEHDVFFADGDLRRWSAVPSSSEEWNWGALGGDRHRLFVWRTGRTAGLQPASIWAVDFAGNGTEVRRQTWGETWGNQIAAFASKDVGVIYSISGDRRDVILTTDGGATWNVTPVPFPKKKAPSAAGNAAPPSVPRSAGAADHPSTPGASPYPSPSQNIGEGVLGLHWVSPSRLLVSGSERSVGLFEIQRNGTLRQLWIITLPEFARLFALNGDYAWVGDYADVSLHRLRLSDGHVDAAVKADRPPVGMAACHQTLLTWDRGAPILNPWATPCPPAPSPPVDPSAESQPPAPPANEGDKIAAPAKKKHEAAPREPDSLSIWTCDAKLGYVRRSKICTRYLDMATGRLGQDIAGILPLEAPFCLIISGQGAGFRLDLDKAALLPIALQVTPPPPAPVGSEREIRQQGMLYLSLLSQVPRSEMEAVGKEYIRKAKPAWERRAKAYNQAVTDPFYGRATVPPSLPGPENGASSPSALNERAASERQSLRECNLWAIRRLRECLESKKPRVLHLNQATDDDLPHIENLASLEYLYLDVSQITDAGLAHLQGAKELQELDLRLTPVTGAGLVHLKKLTKLRRLGLSCPNITDAGLTGLKGLPQLEELDLSGTKITDAGLAIITDLPQLRELNLNGTHITDAGLECLKGFTQLRKLDISRTNVTDAGLVHLKGLIELRWLRLGGGGRSGRMGPNGRIEWTDNSELNKKMGYGNMRITDAGLKHLAALTQLERLDLFCAHITDAGLESLKRLTRLQRLNLGATDVTSEGLTNLQRALPNCQFADPAFW